MCFVEFQTRQGVFFCCFPMLVWFVGPGFISRLGNRDGGFAVVSLQLHLHCDGLLVLLTQTQLLLSPENKNNTSQQKTPLFQANRIVPVEGKILLLQSHFPSKQRKTPQISSVIWAEKDPEARAAFMNSPPVMAERLGVPPGDRTRC